jgi:hypothetical protein
LPARAYIERAQVKEGIMPMLELQASTVDPQIAFENAIAAGHFSVNPSAPNYAGRFMFMGETASRRLVFKNRDTRQYVTFPDLA